MKLKLIEILETFGFPVYLQGSMREDESYPDSFITFWTDSTTDGAHYDNDTKSYIWSFSVIFYSNSPTMTNTMPEQIRKALKAVGFIPQGKGQDIPSDEPTHTGWAMDFVYKENNKGE